MTMEDSEALGWRSVADLIGDHPDAAVALIGAPLNERSLTPGRCDLGPRAFRAVLPAAEAEDFTIPDLTKIAGHGLGVTDLPAPPNP